MTGRWTVKRIVGNGTVFPYWRVQNPDGGTEVILKDRVNALNYVLRVRHELLHRQFAAIVALNFAVSIGGDSE